MMRDWQQTAARYSDDELRLIVDFYGRMEEVLRDHLTRLREASRDPGRSVPAAWAPAAPGRLWPPLPGRGRQEGAPGPGGGIRGAVADEGGQPALAAR